MRGFNWSNLRKIISRPRRLFLSALICGVAGFAVFNHTATGQRRFRGLEADPTRAGVSIRRRPETVCEFTSRADLRFSLLALQPLARRLVDGRLPRSRRTLHRRRA